MLCPMVHSGAVVVSNAIRIQKSLEPFQVGHDRFGARLKLLH